MAKVTLAAGSYRSVSFAGTQVPKHLLFNFPPH